MLKPLLSCEPVFIVVETHCKDNNKMNKTKKNRKKNQKKIIQV